eukprot:COSAG02_NODE_17547_length_996_cov_1.083612_2_plen_130_part_00
MIRILTHDVHILDEYACTGSDVTDWIAQNATAKSVWAFPSLPKSLCFLLLLASLSLALMLGVSFFFWNLYWYRFGCSPAKYCAQYAVVGAAPPPRTELLCAFGTCARAWLLLRVSDRVFGNALRVEDDM